MHHRQIIPFLLAMFIIISCSAIPQPAPPTPATIVPSSTATTQPSQVPQPAATQLVATTPTPPPAPANYTPLFSQGACQFTLPSGRIDGSNVVCGTLTVPADRANPTGPTVTLAVAVFQALGANPAPDPVVYLDGGPGGETLGGTTGWFTTEYAKDLQQNRDLILFDQRGVGLSRPTLDCPEYSEAIYETLTKPLTLSERNQRDITAYETCRMRLQADGIDLNWFSSAASAADVRDLMLVLGYEQWNLFGVSYGTRLALTIMRDQPQGVRSVVLDSVYPLNVDRYIDLPLLAQRAFDTLFDGCAADAQCASAYPNVEQQFYALVARLNDKPMLVNTRNYVDGRNYDILIDGDTVISMLFTSFYITSLIPDLPNLISRANTETALGQTNTLSEWGWVNFLFDGISDGAYNAIECREETPFLGPDALRKTAAEVRPEIARVYGDPSFIQYCPKWVAGALDPRENQAVQSAIPTLLLAGEYDPVTPPDYARRAAQTLSQSTLLEFPGVGHAVFTQSCGMQIIMEFIAEPGGGLNSGCQQEMAGPAFRVP